MTELEKARLEIDRADKLMAELFESRMNAVKTIALYKKENGLRIDDPAREKAMIEKNAGLIKDEELRDYYVRFLRNNIDVSKAMQHRMMDRMRVSYAGVEGAFANIAARRIFPEASAMAYADFKAAYEAVVGGECDCAVLPIENSANGDVGQVMDLAFFGPLHINGVYDIPVIQNLLAVKGAEIGDIKTVISHPQALGQCAEYIHRHGFAQIESVNTAVAAKQVAEMGRKDVAAIGSEEAAEKYGLIKLEAHINGSSVNTTRFAVFSRTDAAVKRPGRFIMVFTVNNVAGSLGRAISIIGEQGFNMRALKSRPAKELVWSYYFFVEGEGDVTSDAGKTMMRKLSACCNSLKIVGCFEKEIILQG